MFKNRINIVRYEEEEDGSKSDYCRIQRILNIEGCITCSDRSHCPLLKEKGFK